MTTKEVIIDVFKEMILPELGEIKENHKEVSLRLDSVEKQLTFVNQHLVDQSRRIDNLDNKIDDINNSLTKRIDDINNSLTKRIDDINNSLNKRIDDTNKRIDGVILILGDMKKEMERIKRESAITGDILHRLEILEERVLLGG